MNKQEIVNAARAQLALDFSVTEEMLASGSTAVVRQEFLPGRRVYRPGAEPAVWAVSFFGALAVAASNELLPLCREQYRNQAGDWAFEAKALCALNRKLVPLGHEILGVALHYLPDPGCHPRTKRIQARWFEQMDIMQFHGDRRFPNAFGWHAHMPDMLAVAAIEGGEIAGMAGASADSASLWQIGIDVMPEHRGKGIAPALVLLLRNEILSRGKIPFYGTGQSHIRSQNVARESGFFPAWSELYTHAIET